MKKLSTIILFAASLAFFPACTEVTNAGSELQKPVAASPTGNEANENEAGENEAGENRNGNASANTTSNGAATSTAADPAAANIKNLLTAYEGETTASAKYAAYSKQAEKEGLHEVAMLFKATSTSENIHANNHKAVLEELGTKIPAVTPKFTVATTQENLQDAISGETYEMTTMYPEFITNADAAQDQLSLVSLNYAYKTEIKHKALYEKALAAVQNNTTKTLATVYYVCPTCGNTYDGTAPKRCGISMTSGEKFIKISNLNS